MDIRPYKPSENDSPESVPGFLGFDRAQADFPRASDLERTENGKNGRVAQRLEHLVYTQVVGDSNSSSPTTTYRAIRISQGYHALVSPENYARTARFNWIALQGRNTVYAVRWDYSGGARRCLYMHRQILGEPNSIVDHRDRDGLHNWDSNLRCATNPQNLANVGPRANREFKGVFAYGTNGRYRAMIMVAGKILHLGCRDTKEEAAHLYDAAALHHYGEFAYLNFPQRTTKSIHLAAASSVLSLALNF